MFRKILLRFLVAREIWECVGKVAEYNSTAGVPF